jgi:spore germination cell wall hydrolase CwlJ-like protein
MIRQILKPTLLACLLASSTYAAKPVNERELAAAVIVAEAGGEGREGMGAVTEVIRNRMKARNLSMYKVVTERNAFSCYNRWRGNPQGFITKWKKHTYYPYALLLINNYYGNSLTKGSCYYHEKKVHPPWSKGVKPTSRVGNHLFFASISY